MQYFKAIVLVVASLILMAVAEQPAVDHIARDANEIGGYPLVIGPASGFPALNEKREDGAAIEPIHGDYGAFEAAKVSHVRRQAPATVTVTSIITSIPAFCASAASDVSIFSTSLASSGDSTVAQISSAPTAVAASSSITSSSTGTNNNTTSCCDLTVSSTTTSTTSTPVASAASGGNGSNTSTTTTPPVVASSGSSSTVKVNSKVSFVSAAIALVSAVLASCIMA